MRNRNFRTLALRKTIQEIGWRVYDPQGLQQVLAYYSNDPLEADLKRVQVRPFSKTGTNRAGNIRIIKQTFHNNILFTAARHIQRVQRFTNPRRRFNRAFRQRINYQY